MTPGAAPDGALPELLLALDGYTIGANDAVTANFGWTLEELAAIPYWELVHPADQDAAVTGVDALLCRRVDTYSETASVLRRDGRYRRGHWTGTLTEDGEAVCVTEVAVAGPAPSDVRRVGTWSWDGSSHRFMCSEELLDLFAWPADRPPDHRALLDVLHPDDRGLLERSARNSRDDDAIALTVEVAGVTPKRWVRLVARPHRDGEGALHLTGIAFAAEGLPYLLPRR